MMPTCEYLRDKFFHRKDSLYTFNQISSTILFILGLFGNTLGFLFSSEVRSHVRNNFNNYRRALNPNEYLLRWFYGVNLFNTLFMIPSPLLKLYGGKSSNPIWNERKWVIYIAKYHYALAKSLITFGFLIYVWLCVNQLIAIVKPYAYKNLVTRGVLNGLLIISLVYATIWHYPIQRWFTVFKFECQIKEVDILNDTSFDPTILNTRELYLYGPVSYALGSGRFEMRLWTAYQVLREVFNTILPFLGVLLCKIILLLHGSKMAHHMAMKYPSLSHKIDVRINNSVSQAPENLSRSSVMSLALQGNQGDKARLGSAIYAKRLMEKQKMARTLFVLTCEFMFLLFPVSTMEMLMDKLLDNYPTRSLAALYILLSIFQYVYVTCTFYLNLIFNHNYRNHIVARCKTLLNLQNK